MSAGGGGGGEAEEGGGALFAKNVFGESSVHGVDLNLTALMDILSNLLFFLLASFGATIIMNINASVPVQSTDKSDVAQTRQAVTLSVMVKKSSYEISASGTAQTADELLALKRDIPSQGDAPDYATFHGYLLEVKQRYPRSDTLILIPEGIRYELLIKTMDAAREHRVGEGVQRHNVPLFPTVVVSNLVK